jgi:nitrogen fixation/metabolism regulation signal transduction histidine kinase
LCGNLDKIAQHGKRADSIVKNMLLHSREGSGEHRPVDVNALVEESLNLAYHGARAENQSFNIKMERSLDPAAGKIDVFPQEITRALLNLISNGFYAATKRKEQYNSEGYEPTLKATTKGLGDRVEIRIRDNGTGIPARDKGENVQSVFHDQTSGRGHGPWPLNYSRHHCQTALGLSRSTHSPANSPRSALFCRVRQYFHTDHEQARAGNSSLAAQAGNG